MAYLFKLYLSENKLQDSGREVVYPAIPDLYECTIISIHVQASLQILKGFFF
jgi:hypothetical protein